MVEHMVDRWEGILSNWYVNIYSIWPLTLIPEQGVSASFRYKRFGRFNFYNPMVKFYDIPGQFIPNNTIKRIRSGTGSRVSNFL
jgi:hypothetical protein